MNEMERILRKHHRLMLRLGWILSCLLVAVEVNAEVIGSVQYETYRVPHVAGRSLAASVNAVTPIREDGKVFHGNTTWHVYWRFRWHRSATGSCAITTVDTTLKVKVLLPELVTTDSAARDVFAAFVEKLRFHEAGHVSNARETARSIDRAIRNLSPRSDCKTLEADANALGMSLIHAGNRNDREYDRLTDHGRTQGAYLQQ